MDTRVNPTVEAIKLAQRVRALIQEQRSLIHTHGIIACDALEDLDHESAEVDQLADMCRRIASGDVSDHERREFHSRTEAIGQIDLLRAMEQSSTTN